MKATLYEALGITQAASDQDVRAALRGLIRKYYGIAPDGQTLVGIYLWENKEAAAKLYTPDWIAMVTKRWGAPALRQEWETPLVVESAERRLVAA